MADCGRFFMKFWGQYFERICMLSWIIISNNQNVLLLFKRHFCEYWCLQLLWFAPIYLNKCFFDRSLNFRRENYSRRILFPVKVLWIRHGSIQHETGLWCHKKRHLIRKKKWTRPIINQVRHLPTALFMIYMSPCCNELVGLYNALESNFEKLVPRVSRAWMKRKHQVPTKNMPVTRRSELNERLPSIALLHFQLFSKEEERYTASSSFLDTSQRSATGEKRNKREKTGGEGRSLQFFRATSRLSRKGLLAV